MNFCPRCERNRERVLICLIMDEGKNVHKRGTNHSVHLNPGRFVRKSEPWQRIHPRGAHQRHCLGQVLFNSTLLFYTSLNSLHIWKQEGNISKARRGKKRHFSAHENCQNFLSEFCLAHLGCWQSCFMVFLLANKISVPDPDLYHFLSLGLFSQHDTISVLCLFWLYFS